MTDKKDMTNTEFVTYLMEYSPAGALSQLVILTAIEMYCKTVVERDLKSPMENFINQAAWQRACNHILNEFTERLK